MRPKHADAERARTCLHDQGVYIRDIGQISDSFARL